jgi:cytochrome o ubiquinol oxidase subunit 3
MSALLTNSKARRKEHRQEAYEADSKATFGFWVYIMTDCVLFAALFATYAVLHNNTFGGPAGIDLFSSQSALAETLILLTSSFTCGLAMLAVQKRYKSQVIFWFAVTFALGIVFLVLELVEFHHLAATGNSWRRSGFLSSFFVLVGTHGLHIAAGLIWMIVMMAQLAKGGLKRSVVRRLTMLSLFWHFLDIVWIFIFTIVYMMGGANI